MANEKNPCLGTKNRHKFNFENVYRVGIWFCSRAELYCEEQMHHPIGSITILILDARVTKLIYEKLSG